VGLKGKEKKIIKHFIVGRRKNKHLLPEINQHKFALLFFELESSKGD
jgi:hypothetical protein